LDALAIQPYLKHVEERFIETVLVLPVTDFPAARMVNFERSADSLPVVRVNPHRRFWIDLLEPTVKRRDSMLLDLPFKRLSDLRISSRSGE
jgi:hypothetical protein